MNASLLFPALRWSRAEDSHKHGSGGEKAPRIGLVLSSGGARGLVHAEARFTDSSMLEAEIGKLVRLVKFFGKITRERISTSFTKLRAGLDTESCKVAQEV
jgi:hypothetical protein